MGFGLGRGRKLDPAEGVIGVASGELPPLPDDILQRPESGWVDPSSLFPNPERPLEIEIGCGKGAFLVQQAPRSEGVNFLGIEWAGEFYAYTADRIRRLGLDNVRLMHADASEIFRWRLPDACCRVIHLYFSDPWPKPRHHKNRVVQHRFLADAWRTLIPGGELRVVTDHDDLWAWDMEHFSQWTCGEPPIALAGAPAPPFDLLPFEPPESAGSGELVGTNFERKFRREGRSFHAGVLRKRC